MPAVSFVIVNYRTPDLTVAAVESALASAADEVIVIDNNSGDESVEVLRRIADPRVQLLLNEVNEGFGRAANRAAAQATAPTLLFLNSDAELTTIACDALVSEVTKHSGRCIAGPRLVGADGLVQHSAGLLPEPADLAIRALGLHRVALLAMRLPVLPQLATRSATAHEYNTAIVATDTTEVTMVSGACFAIGRESFVKLGGFDERYFLYFEDADLCRRATAAGMPIRFVPMARVSHVGGASSRGDYRFGGPHSRSMRQYLSKWHGWGGGVFALLLLWVRAAGMTVALRGSARSAWGAFVSAARDEDPRT